MNPSQSSAPSTGVSETQTAEAERAQAYQRVVIVGLTAILMLVGTLSDGFDPGKRSIAIALIAGSCLCSIGFLVSVRVWPAPSVLRRVLAMTHDFGALTAAMILGGEMFLPAYAIVLWITVGYGLRYDSRYLLGAAALALFALGLLYVFTPYWRNNPYLLATMVLATILVPAYAYRLLAKLREARDAATEASIAKSRFLAHASHDLRQPIHATALLTACLRDTGLQPTQRQIVDDIEKSLDGVASLFRSLLDVSTLDSGGIIPRPEPVAVNDLMSDIALRNAEAARWANASLRLVPSRSWVVCDPNLLTTMLQNIVSNALKYAPGKSVLIGCRRQAGSLTIEIHDRGPGIPARHLDRLFEEFYRVRSVDDRDIDGMGLGLSIVQRLGELMRLRVAVRSTLGRGTSVSIQGLQLVEPPTPTDGWGEGDARPSKSLSGLRVVLVEDDRVTLAATSLTLQRWGCTVQAFSRIPSKVGPCDLLISDFDLGERTTASDCIDRVRSLAGYDLPAIVVTGHNAATVRGLSDRGNVTILSKPVHVHALREALETHLGAITHRDAR